MASLNFIIDAIKTELTTTLFQNNACFYALEPEKSLLTPSGADIFCAIQPNSYSPKTFAWTSDHMTVAYIGRFYFTLHLYVRSALDQAHHDDAWLQDQSFGAVKYTDDIINTLQNFIMTDVNTQNFGVKLMSVDFPTRDRGTPGWSVIKLKYETDENSISQN